MNEKQRLTEVIPDFNSMLKSERLSYYARGVFPWGTVIRPPVATKHINQIARGLANMEYPAQSIFLSDSEISKKYHQGSTEELEREEIIVEYIRGYTIKQLASKYRCTTARINQIIKDELNRVKRLQGKV